MNFKVGDWIIQIDGTFLGANYPVQILKINEKFPIGIYNTYVTYRGNENFINPEFFRLATEAEIKKEKIRNIFSEK